MKSPYLARQRRVRGNSPLILPSQEIIIPPAPGPSGPSSLLTDLIAYYQLDDEEDYLSTYQLTNGNGVTFEEGLVGNGAVYTNDVVKRLYNNSLGNAFCHKFNLSPVSWSAWVYPDAANAVGLEMELLTNFDAGGNEIQLGIWVSHLGLNLYTSTDGSNSVGGAVGITMLDLAWNHLVFRSDPANSRFIFNHNNGSNVYVAYPGTIYTGALGYLAFGLYHQNRFVGKVDEMGFWNKQLSSAEINALYGNGTPPTPPFEGILPT